MFLMDGKATTSELAILENKKYQYYNTWVYFLGERILSKLEYEASKRENDDNIYWCIMFKDEEIEYNKFQWIIKEELMEALDELLILILIEMYILKKYFGILYLLFIKEIIYLKNILK